MFLTIREFESVLHQIDQSQKERTIELFQLLKANGMIEVSK